MKILNIDGLDELPLAAKAIVEELDDHSVAAFYGPMGAGKTTLIKEICSLLGVRDNVTSPTFALVNQYLAENGRTVYHFDFYRIEKIEEAFDMGYEEYFYSGDICLVEWPEKIEGLLPEDVVEVTIEVTGESERQITVNSGGNEYK